jgi:hypothetical protein
MTDEDLPRRPIRWTKRTIPPGWDRLHGQFVYSFLPTSVGA